MIKKLWRLLWDRRRHPRAPEIKGPLEYEQDYAWIVCAARRYFPPHYRVWGMYIHNGQGYAVMVTNGKKVSCFQVRAKIKIATPDTGSREALVDMKHIDHTKVSEVFYSMMGALEK